MIYWTGNILVQRRNIILQPHCSLARGFYYQAEWITFGSNLLVLVGWVMGRLDDWSAGNPQWLHAQAASRKRSAVGARRAPRSAASSTTQQFSLWPGNRQAEGETGRGRSCGGPAAGGRDEGPLLARLLHTCLHCAHCLAGVVAYGLQWRVAAAQIEFGEPAKPGRTQLATTTVADNGWNGGQ